MSEKEQDPQDAQELKELHKSNGFKTWELSVDHFQFASFLIQSLGKSNLITIEQYNDLKKVFKKQSLFLINSTLDEDIEDIFFCLLNEIIKKNKKQKIHKMKKKKCKDKIQKKILKI